MMTRRPGFLAAASLSAHQVGQANPGAHRFWRLNIPSTQTTGSGTDDNFSVAEIAMRGFIGGSDIAGGLTYAASSELDAANNADKAFDDAVGTQLITTESTNAWVSVDFGAGNDAEVHEIVYTSRAGHARQQPEIIRVEYSDDNSLWFVAWIETPDVWLDTQETRTFQAGYAEAQYATTDFMTLSPNLTCEAAWGTLLRNHGYAGPALRVEDNGNPGTFTDVFFNGEGLIKEARPYGDDTRVITLYDQVGTSDLFAVLADDIHIQEHGQYSTWALDFQGAGELTSTDVTNGLQAWEIGNPVWVCGFKRSDNILVRLIWGIQANVGHMKTGLWQEYNDLHWRVNGSTPSDWAGTDWYNDVLEVQTSNDIERAIGDMSSGSPAQAWHNGEDAGTRTFTSPITYDTGHPVNMGGGILSDFNGHVTELAIFDPVIDLSTGDKDALDSALQESDFFLTGQEVATTEQRLHAVFGTNPNVVASKTQRSYALLGTPSGVSTKAHDTYIILGGSPSHMRTRQARAYAIIVP